MAKAGSRIERFKLDAITGAKLARASEALGGLRLMGRLWPGWQSFSRGPWRAFCAINQVRLMGREADYRDLLALGPEPNPSRPTLGLRWATGLILCQGRLDQVPLHNPLTPTKVAEAFWSVDASHLARHSGYGASPLPSQEALPGAGVWALAPRWAQAGLAPLLTAGLCLGYWELEGPDHPNRSPAGRQLLLALAARLGLPVEAFSDLARGMDQAAQNQNGQGGLEGVIKSLRAGRGWMPWLGAFLEGATLSAQAAQEAGLKAQALHQDHHALVQAWVRAPRHPARLLDLLLARPVVDLPGVAVGLGVTQRTAGLITTKLKDLGLLEEITGQRRGRRYAYTQLIEIMEPPPAEPEEADQD